MLDKISSDIKEQLEQVAETQKYRKGEYLFHQNEMCRKIFLIRKGCCRKYYLHDGKEITTEFLFENNFVVSAKSFVLRQPANEFAQALSDVEVLSLSKSGFEKLKDQFPELLSLDLKFVELYTIWLEERLFLFHTQDATSRYLTLIRNQPHIVQQIPLTYIASYLGISLETLSRIRAKIAKDII